MQKYLAFDIETAAEIPGSGSDWRSYRPLGITCIAALPSDTENPHVLYTKTADGAPADRMSRDEVQSFVDYLGQMVVEGYTLLTWNGVGFDFDILAEESGSFDRCEKLVLNHIDMMFHIFCALGHPVALDKAAHALGVPGKKQGMSGALAPKLWAEGRYQEVIEYVAQDVSTALQVAQVCEKQGSLKWTTRKGTVGCMPLNNGWLTVHEALRIPEPDTSWMSHPMSRSDFTAWMSEA